MDKDAEREGAEAGEIAAEPVGRIEHYLTEHDVEYEIIEHEEAMTALEEARKAGAPADDTAKGVLLVQGEEKSLLAVIPASRRLDLKKVRALVGDGELRLATEAEMSVTAPNLEVGALPAIGPDLPAAEIMDRRLLEHDRIVCNSGDHRHSVRVPPGAIVDLTDPILADICED
jgi:Ala-tRNA(Pro) deacylase